MHRSILVGVLGGDGGQLSRDHPKQGPNSQLEGLRRRHVALTDQILQIAQGRTGCPLADGRISPAAVKPPPSSSSSLHHPPKPLTLSPPISPHVSMLSLLFTVSLLLSFSAGSQAMFKMLYSPCWALNLNSCQDFVDPSPLTGTITDRSCFSCFFPSVIQ